MRPVFAMLAAACAGALLGAWWLRPDEGDDLRARLARAAETLPAPAALPDLPPTASDRIESAEALRAGEQATVWTVVRRELARAPHPDAVPLADAAGAHADRLRAFRAGASETPLLALETSGSALQARIERSSLTNPVIGAQFERLAALGVAAVAVPRARGSASSPP